MALRTMTTHTAELLKGPKPMLGPIVDRVATFVAAQLANIRGGYIPKGRIVSLNSSGAWRLGVGSTNATVSPPWLLLNNSDDLDVDNTKGGTPATDYGAWKPAMPTGKANAVSLLQGHLLQTGEFKTALNYSPGQALSAPLAVSDSDAAELADTAGVLTNSGIKPYKQTVVGYVVEPFTANNPTRNAHNQPVLTWLPTYLPALDVNPALTFN